MITQEDGQKIQQFLAQKVPQCLCCSNNTFTIHNEYIVSISEENLLRFRNDEDAQYVRKIMYTCDECGYVMYFVASKLGL